MSTELLNLLVLVAFVGGLLLGVVSTGLRIIEHIAHHHPLPILLPRDLIVVGGLALSFLAVAVVSLLNAMHVIDGQALGRQAWWVLLRATPAIVAVWTFDYFELRVIGRKDGKP
jgi:hypothetical protein